MDEDHRINGLPTRPLGGTGLRVTVLGVGGFHVGEPAPEEGIRIIRTAIDEGVNFLDNAWCYHDGESERLMGRALRDGYRDRVVLMTKNHGRDADSFRRQLDQSLQRLGTDCIDILQFHDISQPDEPDRLFDGGAVDAAVEARRAGKIRFIGFTGHRLPAVHRLMLDKDFPWDTVQCPVSVLDAHFHSFQRGVLPVLRERGIGAIGMKSLSSGRVLQTGIGAGEAIAYALSQDIATLVSGMESVDDLARNLATVRAWAPMAAVDQQALLARSAPYARDGRLERHKTA
ncbi:MAG: aldo/keto reductase [bacterium]